MTRRGRVAVAAAALLAGAVAGTGPMLRRAPFFRLRQVELIGVRYLAPDTVLHALALAPGQSVFGDLDAVAARAAALDGIVSARVERKLPGTLQVVVVERVPVAFVPGRHGLQALDGEGRVLPFDPAVSALDLPVIAEADSLLVRALSVVRLADSSLFRHIDGARLGPRGAIRLELGRERVLLAGVPLAEDVRALGAVRRHLIAAGRRYRELDGRYRGWVVVRRSLT